MMLFTALAPALTACEGSDWDRHALTGPEANRLISSVEIRPFGSVLEPDSLQEFAAVVRSARGTVVSRNVSWKSLDESVLKVDASGNVVAMNEGTATLEATHQGVTGQTTVDVHGEVVSIRLSQSSLAVDEGETAQLEATYVYANGAERPAGPLEWWTDDPTILGVDSDGLARGMREGITRIRVRGRGHELFMEGLVRAGTVASVEVVAPGKSLAVGDQLQFWAEIYDTDGTRLVRPVEWSSSNSSVASVSAAGLVKARESGEATIRARTDGVTGSVQIQVGSSGSQTEARPGGVTNLSVVSTEMNSATLRFTEVDDGVGEPAKYEIRYAGAPLGFGWGSATSVSKGSCMVPVQGTEIGYTRTCTVEGLQPGTKYDFQLVPFRGTLRVDAIFGPLSNISGGTTKEAPIKLDVLPSGASLDVGAELQVRAAVTDLYGNPLNKTVSWSSSRTSVATVSGSGNTATVKAVNPGDSDIRATADGVTGVSKIRVTQPAPGDASGLPSGYRWLTQNPWDRLTGGGWTDTWNDRGYARIVHDQSAPQSCCNVLEHRYPKGFTGGSAPGTLDYSVSSTRGVYISTWWKANSDWQRHSSGIDKLIFVFPTQSGMGQWSIIWYFGGHLRVAPQRPDSWSHLSSNIDPTGLRAGRWYHIEWLLEHEVGQYWTVKWWVDGTLRGSHQRVPWQDLDLSLIRKSPTWGGVGDTKQQDDYFRWDHTAIAKKD